MTTQTITQTLSAATLTLSAATLTAGGTTAMYGPVASGKSTALAGIAKEALAAGREVVVIDLVFGADIEGARVITRAKEAVRFLHGALDRFRFDAIGFSHPVSPVILVEEFQNIAEEHLAVAELIRELIQTRSSVFTTVIADQRRYANAPLHEQSVVYLASPYGKASAEAVAQAFGTANGNAAHELLAETSAKGVYGHAVASINGAAPEALSF